MYLNNVNFIGFPMNFIPEELKELIRNVNEFGLYSLFNT